MRPVASQTRNDSSQCQLAGLSLSPEAKSHQTSKVRKLPDSRELLRASDTSTSPAALACLGENCLNHCLVIASSDPASGLRRQMLDTVPRNVFLSSWSYRIGKRAFDLLLAVALLPVLLPVCLLLMFLIKGTSKGPVFYRHLRVGKNGRDFYLYKFRTMFLHDEALLEDYLAGNEDARQEWEEQYKLRRDPRVTPLGATLRRTSLDELPQIINVLLGQMSFVGPRPIVHEEIVRYGAAFSIYAEAKPGITGLWQVSGRGNVSYQRRVYLDVAYVRNWSFLEDLKVLLKTAGTVCTSVGAF